ncbi:hypothetical protein MRB53_020263 [Persea americana]|uniref:Uncharacterized protein n=1 Tax=Persea americana TaxID=3435 RepID=A0ACC2L0P3_PERAE|nr:hypothetical protein MRB53_020263 [Persea americana]
METDTRFVTTSDDWSCLGSDLTELILSYLPLRSIVRAGAVCKAWRSVVTHPSFSARVSAAKKPWFFLCGKNNIFSKNNQAFGFDPEADEWISLPTALFPRPKQEESFIGSGGFFFFTTTSSTCSRFSYAPVLKSDSWRETPPLRFSRCNPLVGVFAEGGGPKFIVVGGVRFIGGLVDIEDRLAVEIYDPAKDVWELCPPLPEDFRSGNSSQWLSSALLGGKLFVFGIYSCYVSAFDLERREWSGVRMVRPAGVLFSFLVACGGWLVLAGLCNTAKGASFVLWRVEEGAMELGEVVGVMPEELLHCLFESDEDDKFASLKCVGLGDLVYVFNEEPHRVYPACVCQIGKDFKCSWRKLPEIPLPVNRFHKVVSFCSNVSLDSVLR